LLSYKKYAYLSNQSYLAALSGLEGPGIGERRPIASAPGDLGFDYLPYRAIFVVFLYKVGHLGSLRYYNLPTFAARAWAIHA